MSYIVSSGGVLVAEGVGQYLHPTGPGQGSAVRNGLDAYGSWSPLHRAAVTVPDAPTETGASPNVAMPGTVNAGDLLVAFVSRLTNGGISTPAGWTEIATQVSGVTLRMSAFYKVADGTEGGTSVTFTGGATSQVYRILAGAYSGVPIGTTSSGTSTNPNPAAVTPPSARAFLSLVASAVDTPANIVTAAPANYSGFDTLSGTLGLGSAYRNCNADTEDPGTFTAPSDSWVDITVAIYAPVTATEALYITGLDIDETGTPDYLQIQIGTGAEGAESAVGTYKVLPGDNTLEFGIAVPIANGARLSARLATSAAAANHFVTLHVIAQANVNTQAIA